MHVQFSTAILFCLSAANIATADQSTLTDDADRINYSIGHQIGSDFKRQKIGLNEEALRQGLQHGHAGAAPLVDAKEMQMMLVDLKRNITSKMKKESVERINSRKQIEFRKRSAGAAFLQANQGREGVKTMPSGLQYRVITEGRGVKPEANDYVTINYRAKTLEGREYDSSYKRGKPATYPANGIIPGFTEAIQMMQPGAKWELYIPPELAYGRQGPLAHQTVIIEVELISVSKRN
jgi:FKBP-type peptidyl-prolyl cis-trans isomerase FklB